MASINASTSGAGGIITTADNTGTLNLQSGGTTIATVSSTGLSMATGKTLSVGGVTGSPYQLKNRIINGDMKTDQRNAGSSVTPTASAYTLDRWEATMSASSKFSVQQVSANANTSQGFDQSLRVTSLSAYTVGTSEAFTLTQYIEGYNVADMAFGTSGAKTFTLSFWVYSSLTGTFGGALQNSGRTRSYPFTYTISAANTWEQKTITVAGDTTGTWLTTNGRGLNVIFSLGTGATLSGTAGAWATATYYSATGATSVVGTNGATFYITGVQLETGSSATQFEWRPYGQELNLCQRYYQRYTSAGTGECIGFGGYGFPQTASVFRTVGSFPVTFRGTPTFAYSNLSVSTSGGTQATVSSSAGMTASSTAYDLNLNVSVTTGTPYFLRATAGNSGYVDFSAEL